jgi:hypothetical protein
MATKDSGQGRVKDPEHDGRLKGHHGGEAAAAHESGKHVDQRQQGQQSKGGSKAEATEARSEGGDDLKAREYTDAQGNVHHHTKAYMEQHKG